MPKHKFPKGNKYAKGGVRPGAGRPPDHLRQRAREIAERSKVLEFYGKVIDGEDMEQVVTGEGTVLGVPAAVRDRIKAGEVLLKFGHPDQLELSGQVKVSLVDLVARARGQRGLPEE